MAGRCCLSPESPPASAPPTAQTAPVQAPVLAPVPGAVGEPGAGSPRRETRRSGAGRTCLGACPCPGSCPCPAPAPGVSLGLGAGPGPGPARRWRGQRAWVSRPPRRGIPGARPATAAAFPPALTRGRRSPDPAPGSGDLPAPLRIPRAPPHSPAPCASPGPLNIPRLPRRPPRRAPPGRGCRLRAGGAAGTAAGPGGEPARSAAHVLSLSQPGRYFSSGPASGSGLAAGLRPALPWVPRSSSPACSPPSVLG